MPEDKGVCFVICPIGEEGSKERKRSDGVLEFLVKPAAEELGYRAERTIEAPRPGWITERIVRLLYDAPMVVADLSGRNPNVFYELAIRHAVRKPFVQIMQAGEEVPFDVSGLHMIFYEYGDWSSAAAAREQLVEQMRIAAEHPEAIRTPVSIAGDLEALQGGQAPTEALLRDILEFEREIAHRLETQESSVLGRLGSLTWDDLRNERRAYEARSVDKVSAALALQLLAFEVRPTSGGVTILGSSPDAGQPDQTIPWQHPVLSSTVPQIANYVAEHFGIGEKLPPVRQGSVVPGEGPA